MTDASKDKRLTIGWESKRKASLFLGVLAVSKAATYDEIRYGKFGETYFIEFPESDVSMAALYGYIAGRGGYCLGGYYPEDAVSLKRKP